MGPQTLSVRMVGVRSRHCVSEDGGGEITDTDGGGGTTDTVSVRMVEVRSQTLMVGVVPQTLCQ